jgi:simple sugar transport system permease protein
VALFLAVVVGLLPRTVAGFDMRMTGLNADTARYSGIRTVRVAALALTFSGAFAGLAGTSLILASELSHLFNGFSANYGFEGIIVGLLAHNNAWGCVIAALLFAFLRQGGGYMEATAGVPAQLVLITQGLVIILVAASDLALRRWTATPPAGLVVTEAPPQLKASRSKPS